MLLFDTESNEIRNIEPNGPIGDKEVAWIHFEGHQVEQTYEFIKNYLRPHKLAFINLFRNNYQPKFHQYKDHAFMTLFGITGLFDLKDHMNSIMQTLTMVSVIFIPITFLAGIYGMNFEEMPELKWKYGYPALWLVLLTIASVTIGYFRKRRWW